MIVDISMPYSMISSYSLFSLIRCKVEWVNKRLGDVRGINCRAR